MKRALRVSVASALSAVSVVLGGYAAPATAAGQAPADPAVPTLNWTACPGGGAFRCATATVPMDYAKPDGATFSLALIKYPAKDPVGRIGTVFWNPGGPGGSGTEALPATISGLPAEVLRRFDVVSWDPRGMGGGSTPVVQCFDSVEEEVGFLGQVPTVPTSEAEFARAESLRAEVNARCVQRNGDLLAHVSTADTARDLDLLRQAVGDEKTTYYGVSYGTVLGATYINMFPDKVRAAVLDGAVFPSAWGGGPGTDQALSTFLRIGSDVGGQETVDEFIRQCGMVGPDRCSFSAGSVEATRQKWSDLLARLRVTPATVDGGRVNDRDLVSALKSLVYVVDPGWASAARFLQGAHTAATAPQAAAAGVPGARGSAAPGSRSLPPGMYGTSIGRLLSVVCGESPNPDQPSDYTPQARLSYARAGYSGWPFVAFCAGWTTKAAAPYGGPWNTPAAAPVVVVNTTFDPATPYASAERAVKELANAHLITVQGFGHSQQLNPSRCAQDLIAAYMIDGTLPMEGASCPQDGAPFG